MTENTNQPTIQAHYLYVLRELTGFVSGTDLHWLFEQVCGEPSPSGYVELDVAKLEAIPMGKEALELLRQPFHATLDAISDYTLDQKFNWKPAEI